MEERLRKRREKLLRLYFSGVPDFCKRVAAESDVKVSTVRRDWNRRDQWLEELTPSAIPEAVLKVRELLVERKQAREEAWKFYHRTETGDNAAIGALNLITKSSYEDLKIVRSLVEMGEYLESGIPKDEKVNVIINPPGDDPAPGQPYPTWPEDDEEAEE